MIRSFQTRAIATRVFHPGEDLLAFLLEALKDPPPLEGSLLAITSKIISLAENRIVPKDSVNKKKLVQKESDFYLGEIGYGCHLTIKHGLFIASAGIDESNSETGNYILYPEAPFETAQLVLKELKRHFGLKNFGVLVTDSHTSPLRAGVNGVALAHAGFRAVESQVGKPDLFGRNLTMTQINVADAMAAAAVYCMGEAAEACPLAWIQAPVAFIEEKDENPLECQIPWRDDLYAPLYKGLEGMPEKD